MIKNYLITAFRSLRRNKTYTLINVFGLALGISAALVLFKVVLFEMSFDNYHSNNDRLYRFVEEEVDVNGSARSPGIPNPFTTAFKNDFPEYGIPIRTRYKDEGQLSVEKTTGQVQHFQIDDGIAFADKEIFQAFDFELIVGDPNTVLAEPRTAVISESLAFKLFGADRSTLDGVIGREIKLDNKLMLRITGISANPPPNTVLPFSMLIEYGVVDGFYESRFKDSWSASRSDSHVYLLIAEGVNPEQIESKMATFEEKYIGENKAKDISFLLQPFRDIHFQPEIGAYEDRVIDRSEFIFPILVGIFLILTACVNFVNLATVQAVKRAKETGIRMVLGSQKRQLIIQVFAETFFVTVLAVFLSLGLAELAMMNFQNLIGHDLSLDLFNDPMLTLLIGIVTIVVMAIAGTYPAMILSSLKPISALQGKGRLKAGKTSLRRGLVIFQFATSQILVICTLVVISQMDYFQSKELGFRRTSIINFSLPDNDENKLDLLQTRLLQNAQISNVSFAYSSPRSTSNIGSPFNYAPLKNETSFEASLKMIDENYLPLYDIKLLAGRNLNSSDASQATILISESVMRLMNFTNPEDIIGEKIDIWDKRTIIGVFEDFHARTLKEEIVPLLMLNYPSMYQEAAVRFTGDETQLAGLVSLIETAWSAEYPNEIFDYTVYSEALLEDYKEEAGILNLLEVFSGIAILIGCLGLYGLISYIVNQKTKEIGIRKVLGASVMQILGMFSRELLVLITISFAVAAPIAYFAINGWLQEFEYRITVSLWVFIMAIGFTLVMGGLTAGFKSVKTARANPVESLREE